MNRFVALLRGINVSGSNAIAMADLRALCVGLGWSGVATYIQSGNIVFAAEAKPDALELQLEQAIAKTFRLAIPVLVRIAAQWPAYLAGNPFAQASATEPNRVMLCLSKAPPDKGCATALQEKAAAGEQVRLVGDAVWIHFPGGSGTSKLSPALMNRLVGSPVTARNVRTARKLAEMLAA